MTIEDVKHIKCVYCQICKVAFMRITNTHLKTRHQITIEKYKEMFPGFPIDSEGLANRRVRHLKNKSYEEIYGTEKAFKLKQQRKEKIGEDWKKNPVRIRTKNRSKEKKRMIERERELNPPLIGRPRVESNHGMSICNNCGKEFAYSTTDRKGLFCCKKCNTEYSRIHSTHYRVKAFAHFEYKCMICGSKERLLVHHKDLNRSNDELENLQVLCPTCHRKQHPVSASYRGVFSEAAIESGIRMVLSGLRVDIRDANFFETPKRVARMFAEILEGLLPSSKEEISLMLSKTFPCDNQDMIIIKDIQCWSMCPHHLLPVKYKINIAYIPDQKVLGLSKIPRLAILLAKRPVLQEQLVCDIAQALEQYTAAKGVIVNIVGEHLCMQMRGVKAQGSSAETTNAVGLFKENLNGCKDEFMSRIQGR